MLRALFWGTLLSLGIWLGAFGTGVAITVMSSNFTNDISLLVSLVNIAAPFFGGYTAGWIIKERGWANGGWVGVLFTLTAALLAALLFPGLFLLKVSTLFINFCLGCIGGICGVNVALAFLRKRRKGTPGMQ
ncbi:MAG: TIGR04086 family membrane protein [Bacillota bacterium]